MRKIPILQRVFLTNVLMAQRYFRVAEKTSFFMAEALTASQMGWDASTSA